MSSGIIYFGVVTGFKEDKLYVSIPVLGEEEDQFGPLKALVTVDGYAKDDPVLVGQYGLIEEDLVVLGKVAVA
jgi:hypothetical protein